jgi:hypothetical protein
MLILQQENQAALRDYNNMGKNPSDLTLSKLVLITIAEEFDEALSKS